MLTAPMGSMNIIAAPSYENIRNGALRTLLQIISDIERRSGMSILDGPPTLSPPYHIKLIGGREYVFFSSNNFNMVRGMSAAMCWFDEPAYMNEYVDGINTLWTVAMGRLNVSPGQIIMTSSPNYRNPWPSKIFADNANNPQYEVINAKSTDNFYLSGEYKEALKKSYTSEMYAQEVLGQDINPAGAMFQRHWLRTTDTRPHNAKWFRYWDLASSVKQSADYTASVRVCLHDGVFYIADGIKVKAEWPDVRRIIVDTMRREADTTHGIEKAQHGLAAVQELRRIPEIADVAFKGIDVKGDKVQRAMPWASRAEAGAVAVVNGAWVRDFLDEVVAFPSAPHDDYVDAASGAVAMISKPRVEWGFA
ncbi:Archaeophage PsiM2, terminase large subunit [uncultured Caudovirales phage]|uniref:Archaeophage PsiM2, terminase large subunit n=1 Tax=uncultured Caudovirales phage TaxID=2100421 RepID=A0A6J5NTV6_9CAUD|nr:Archaeophage PsiM2, terminase large subunit [uncultured Caudovirales phage]